MTYHFGRTSTQRLNTCHHDIQAIMVEALANSHIDMTIVCGERTREEQEKAFSDGFSKARYGQSPHNFHPSRAVDVAPYKDGKIQWEDEDLFTELAEIIRAANKKLLDEGVVSIELRWGNDWDGDGVPVDQDPDERFKDMPHWEILGWKDMG